MARPTSGGVRASAGEGSGRVAVVSDDPTSDPQARARPAILLAAPPPINPIDDVGSEMFYGGSQKSASLAQRYKAVAEKWGCCFLDVAALIKVDAADGIHYSEASHRALGKAMADHVLNSRQLAI